MTALPVPAARPVDDLTLERLGEPALAFVVVGSPAPQGSKKAIMSKRGQPVVIESSKHVVPWRAAVASAARSAAGPDFVPLDGPLVADVILTLRRPLSAPKRTRAFAYKYPDLSKLLRATEDGLGTDAGVIVDDARLVAFRRLAKVLARDVDPDALSHPGAIVRLWRYPAGEEA